MEQSEVEMLREQNEELLTALRGLYEWHVDMVESNAPDSWSVHHEVPVMIAEYYIRKAEGTLPDMSGPQRFIISHKKGM